MATKKKKVRKADLTGRAKSLKPGESTEKISDDQMTRGARELVQYSNAHLYLQRVLPTMGDREAIKHAADVLSAQLELMLKRHGERPKGSLGDLIRLAAKLNPPILDTVALRLLRGLDRIYRDFHDGTLHRLEQEEEVVARVDRLMPALARVAPSPRARLDMAIFSASAMLHHAGGRS